MRLATLKILLLLSLPLLLNQPLAAQVSILSGKAPSYSGDELVFYQYSDMITFAEEQVGKCVVGADGTFVCSLKIDQTAYVFTYLGIYKGYLFIEPGSRYTLLLPNKEEMTEAQRLNPFFRKTDLHLGIKGVGPTDINFMIGTFDLAFNENFDKIVMDAYYSKQTIPIDSLIQSLEGIYSQFNHSFFNSYRQYRYGLLQQLSLLQKSRSISDNYFLNQPVLYNNPAYMELFNLVYDKYFLHVARTAEGEALFDNISDQRSFTRLKNTLAQDEVLSNDTLIEMVVLKGLYDGFFDDKFSRSAMLNILDSIYSTTTIAEHLVIAQNIRTKVTRLLPGFVPVPFELYSADGKLVSLNDFKGRYVYLNFCTTTSYTCLQEFLLLNRLHEKHGKILDIVTVSTDKNKENMRDFLEQTKYPWTFLHYGKSPQIIRDFDIRAYPTYFLIGPDQRLILSPAPTPRENFEIQLFRILRSRGDI